MIVVTFTSPTTGQANANAFGLALWDALKTLRAARADDRVPAFLVTQLTRAGIGRWVDETTLTLADKWGDAIKHPTQNVWAIPLRAWIVALLDQTTTRGQNLRAALISGPTITTAGGPVTNYFWRTDVATTTTRFDSFATKLATAFAAPNDWRQVTAPMVFVG
jgi:hypothetical protein